MLAPVLENMVFLRLENMVFLRILRGAQLGE